MAIKLIANYSKRLGLPGYSSHQFEVSIETEISNPADVQAESERIYHNLQRAADAQIQQVGFVPDEQYGKLEQAPAPSRPFGCNQSKGYSHHSERTDSPAPQEER